MNQRTPLTPLQAISANQKLRDEMFYVHCMLRRNNYDLKENETVNLVDLNRSLAGAPLDVRFEIKSRLARLGLLVD
jgi:hypothetical protein